MEIKGKVKIYTLKSKKNGKIYPFKQIKILVKAKYLPQLEQYDNKEVSLLLNGGLFYQASLILLKKFMELPSECREQIIFSDEEARVIKQLISIMEKKEG